MDSKLISDVIQTAIVSISAATAISLIARYSFLKRKYYFETYKERSGADIRRIESITKALEDSNYREYLKQRDQMYRFWLQERTGVESTASVPSWKMKEYLDGIVGRNPPMGETIGDLTVQV